VGVATVPVLQRIASLRSCCAAPGTRVEGRGIVVRFFLYAVVVMLAGLSLLLAMVVRVVEPALGLSLLGYASFFAGMLLTLMGAIRYIGSRR
jgi:hypothetical protein